MKTAELTGHALDWAVAKCQNNWAFEPDGCDSYSTDWELGGPIIEEEMLAVVPIYGGWASGFQSGPTPLIAAMRCYVASVLGDEVDVPEAIEE